MNVLIFPAVLVLFGAGFSALQAYRGVLANEFTCQGLVSYATVVIVSGLVLFLVIGFWSELGGIRPIVWLLPDFPGNRSERAIYWAYLLVSSGVAVVSVAAYFRLRGRG